MLCSLEPQLCAAVAESDDADLPSATIPVVLDPMDIMRRDKPPHADFGPDQVWADVMHLAPTQGDLR